MNRILSAVLTGMVVLPGVAAATSLNIDAAPCAETIYLRATDAPLGEVIRKLSESMKFRLESKVELPEKITLDRTDEPTRLLKQLMQGRNLVIQTDPSPACGGKSAISKVWILPTGEAAPARADVAPPAPILQYPGDVEYRALRPPRPRGTRKRMSDAEWQQMRKDYRAGKIMADPVTGLPIPIPEPQAPKPDLEAGDAPQP